MVSVKVTDGARFNATETVGGRITKKSSATVPVTWAIPRLNDASLIFTFEEEDREALLSLPEKFLALSSKTTGKDITSHAELEMLLLPPLKKRLKSKSKPKTTTPKPEPPIEE